jgi:hypothetical protein
LKNVQTEDQSSSWTYFSLCKKLFWKSDA